MLLFFLLLLLLPLSHLCCCYDFLSRLSYCCCPISVVVMISVPSLLLLLPLSLVPPLSHLNPIPYCSTPAGKNRALREEMYRAYISRASSGDIDNAPIITRILELRQQQAQLLGFSSYAEVSLARKMATLPKAEALLEELRAASYPAAKHDLEEVTAFAAEFDEAAPKELSHWDVSYYAERLREDK